MISEMLLFVAGGTSGAFAAALLARAANTEVEHRAWHNGHDAGMRTRNAEEPRWKQ